MKKYQELYTELDINKAPFTSDEIDKTVICIKNGNAIKYRAIKSFDSIDRNEMRDILLTYGIPKEVVNAIMILYINTRAMVRSPDGDTTFFKITTGVLQGDTIAPFLFIICLDYENPLIVIQN